MDQNVVFKTAAVGGFEKRAVLDYIYQMNEDTEKEKNEQLSKIAELEEALQSKEENKQHTNNNMRTLEKDLASVSNELTAEKSRRLEMDIQIDELKTAVENQTRDLEKQLLEITRLREAQAKLPDLEELELASLEAKREEIEKASYQVGRVMLDARADADAVVENAKEQAIKILSQGESDTVAMRSSAQAEADRLVETAREDAQSQLDKASADEDRIIGEATKLAEGRVRASQEQSREITSKAKANIAKMVHASRSVAESSSSQLDYLKTEIESISTALKESFQQLESQTNQLTETIGTAKTKISSEQAEAECLKLMDLSGISLAEIEEVYGSDDTSPQTEKVLPQSIEEVEELELVQEELLVAEASMGTEAAVEQVAIRQTATEETVRPEANVDDSYEETLLVPRTITADEGGEEAKAPHPVQLESVPQELSSKIYISLTAPNGEAPETERDNPKEQLGTETGLLSSDEESIF